MDCIVDMPKDEIQDCVITTRQGIVIRICEWRHLSTTYIEIFNTRDDFFGEGGPENPDFSIALEPGDRFEFGKVMRKGAK